MIEVSVHEAKTHLSRLLRRIATGEEVTISRSGKPVARLIPIFDEPVRKLGLDADRVRIAEDFDAPLPEELLKSFEG